MGTASGARTGDATGLTTIEASLLAGVAEKTIRNWVKAGHIPLERTPHGRRIPREPLLNYLRERALTAVEGVPPEARPEESTGPTTGPAPEPFRGRVPDHVPDSIGAQYRVTPAEIERAVSRTSAQYMGDLRTMLAEVGKVYEGQLAAKDETIAELRRRAEVAEAELAGARLRLAEVSVPPVVVVAAQDAMEGLRATETTPTTRRPVQSLWWRLRRIWRGI